MSLILVWENPPICYDPRCHAVQVWRGTIGSGVLIEPDATWGVYEDETESDLKADLNVSYVDEDGSSIAQILAPELRKFLRPINVCKLTIDITAPDGGPADGRVVDISTAENTEFNRRIVTNRAGKAIFFGVRGMRYRIYIEGMFKALDCVMPNQATIDWPGLAAFGSWIDADRRSKV